MKLMLVFTLVVVGALAVVGSVLFNLWQSQDWISEPVSLEVNLHSGGLCMLLEVQSGGRLRVDCRGYIESIRYYCVTHGSEADPVLAVIMTDTVRLIWRGRGADGVRLAEVFTHNPEDITDTENVGLSLVLGGTGQVRDDCQDAQYLTAQQVSG